MARQSGVLKLKGKIDDLSFYHNKQFGYIVRRKGGATRERIATDPQFARTRENSTEFAAATKAAKLIRHTVRAGLHLTGDNFVTQRLNRQVMKIVHMDVESERGQRRFASGLVHDEARRALNGFPFYEACPLAYMLPIRIVYTSENGAFTLTGLNASDLPAPKGATQIRIQGMTGVFDFETQAGKAFATEPVVIALNEVTGDLMLQSLVVPSGIGVRIGFLSVSFLQEQSGELYRLEQGKSVGILF